MEIDEPKPKRTIQQIFDDINNRVVELPWWSLMKLQLDAKYRIQSMYLGEHENRATIKCLVEGRARDDQYVPLPSRYFPRISLKQLEYLQKCNCHITFKGVHGEAHTMELEFDDSQMNNPPADKDFAKQLRETISEAEADYSAFKVFGAPEIGRKYRIISFSKHGGETGPLKCVLEGQTGFTLLHKYSLLTYADVNVLNNIVSFLTIDGVGMQDEVVRNIIPDDTLTKNYRLKEDPVISAVELQQILDEVLGGVKPEKRVSQWRKLL